jgi:hypothetical protein
MPNNTPLSDFWVIEYNFTQDSFSVRELPDYLTRARESFNARKLWFSVILGVYPMRQGASEQCDAWQEERNKRPLTARDRINELRPYLEGLESQLE